jgi:hypothetical protein
MIIWLVSDERRRIIHSLAMKDAQSSQRLDSVSNGRSLDNVCSGRTDCEQKDSFGLKSRSIFLEGTKSRHRMMNAITQRSLRRTVS